MRVGKLYILVWHAAHSSSHAQGKGSTTLPQTMNCTCTRPTTHPL